MKDKVTLAEIVEQLSDETYISKSAAQDFISSLTDVLLDEVNEKGKAAITNFGSFTVVEVAKRNGVNPQTGEPIAIPAHKRISFTPYKALEKKVNQDFDHLEARVLEDNSEVMPKNKGVTSSEPNSAEALFNTLTSSPGKQPSADNDPFNFDAEPELNETDTSESAVRPPFEQSTIETPPSVSDDDVLDDILGLSSVPNDPESSGTELNVEKESVSVNDEEEILGLVESEPPTLYNVDGSEAEDTLETADSRDDEDSDDKKTALRTPGLPKRNSNALSPTVLVATLAAFLVLILAVWFLWLRPESPPTELAVNNSAVENSTQEETPANNASENTPQELAMGDNITESETQVIPMIAADVDISENPGEMRSLQDPEPQVEMQEVLAITYTTSNGVWIYEIARQTYGNTRLWPLIFQANYTTANDPDLILPNINLNIPKLEGTTEAPSTEDYRRLADAARYVALAYEQAGNANQADAYRKAADWYESMR